MEPEKTKAIQNNVGEPTPVPTTAPTSPTPTPKPDINPSSVIPDAIPAQTTPPKNKYDVPVFSPGTTKTFNSDLAGAMRNTSLTKIAIAENKKVNQNSEIITNKAPKQGSMETSANGEKKPILKNIVLSLLALALIAGGVWGGYYFYSKSPLAPVKVDEVKPKYKGIFDAENIKEVTIGKDSQANQIVSNVKNNLKNKNSLGTQKFTELVFTVDENGVKKIIPANTFINAFNTQIPESFLRTTLPRFMFGYQSREVNVPFIILKTDFYQNAVTGMLKWEKNIYEDLKDYFIIPKTDIADNSEISTSTQVSSTTQTSDLFFKTPKFSDQIINNKDTRIIKDDNGQIILLYSFIDNQTLIITSSPETFKDILNKISNQIYTR